MLVTATADSDVFPAFTLFVTRVGTLASILYGPSSTGSETLPALSFAMTRIFVVFEIKPSTVPAHDDVPANSVFPVQVLPLSFDVSK